MAGWHHWLDGHESEWTPGVGDGQGGLACCDSWGHKESDTTERLIWSDLIWSECRVWVWNLGGLWVNTYSLPWHGTGTMGRVTSKGLLTILIGENGGSESQASNSRWHNWAAVQRPEFNTGISDLKSVFLTALLGWPSHGSPTQATPTV